MSRFAFALLLLAPLAAPSLAQGGGFEWGDMWMISPSAVDGPVNGYLVRFDMEDDDSGLVMPLYNVPSNVGNMAFDPYRQRLILRASLGSAGAPVRIWALDASGTGSDLGFVDQYSSFAPVGDGRIYMRNHQAVMTNSPIVCIDAYSEPFTLQNASGTGPFTLDGNPGLDFRGMIYDTGTNALFLASFGPAGACPAGAVDKITIRKVPLNADGTRVGGPTSCVSTEVSSSGETPVGWSRGASGELILVADTNSNNQEPRMLAVDPVTLAVSTWASNGPYTGAAATNAGAYSSYLDEVVILDTLNDELRTYALGQTGFGNFSGIVDGLSSTGGSGEQPTIIDLPDPGCNGGWGTYNGGIAGAGGLRPRIVGVGCPEIGGAFSLKLDRCVGGAPAQLFLGLAPTSVPFKGGFFVVNNVFLNVQLALSGTPGVAGAGAVTLPSFLPADGSLIGLKLYMQVLVQDAAAVKGVATTKGLRMEIG